MPGRGNKNFPTTRWDLLAEAARCDLPGKTSFSQVLTLYLPSIRRYLTYVKRLRPQDVDEHLQGFVTDKFVTRYLLERADQSRGKFRNLLVRSLEHYLISQLRKQRAGVDVGSTTSLDTELESELAATDASGPSEAFDLEWAKAVVTESLLRTRQHFDMSGKPEIWNVFEKRVLAPAADGVAPVDYADLVEMYKFSSPHQAANALITAKRCFDRKLREVLAEENGRRVDQEEALKDLLAIFARGGAVSFTAPRMNN